MAKKKLAERILKGVRRHDVGDMVADNRVTLLHDGEQCLPAMLDAIENAEREIMFEMYWFASDRTGRRFSDALAQKAREGIGVYITYDSFGCLETDETMFDMLRKAGCYVYEYHPIKPWRSRFKILQINNRNHRKLLVVDSRVGMTGGVNIADQWAPVQEGGLGFRDDMIRVEGPIAEQLRSLFLRTFPYRYFNLDIRHRNMYWNEDFTQYNPENSEDSTVSAIADQSYVAVLANENFKERRYIRQAYLSEIDNATSSISITNSYFIPDRTIRQSLAKAVERGVHVQVLLPIESDVPPIQYAAHNLYEWLLTHGIEIYEWGPRVLHSKTAVIDKRWCTVGSFNLDTRSWKYSLEVNLAVQNTRIANALHDQFEKDLKQSVLIDYDDWKYRPLSERTFENVFYLFRNLL